MGWMAPLRHLSAILLSDRISSTWACTRSFHKERRVLRKQLPRCAGSGVLQSSAALCGRPGGARDGALLATRLACAWTRGATDAGAIREAYIKRNKHDAADAEAICQAVQRPTMRLCRSRWRSSKLLCCCIAAASSWCGNAPCWSCVAGTSGGVRADGGAGLAQHGSPLYATTRQARARYVAGGAACAGYQIEQIGAAVGALERQLLVWHNRNAVTQRLASIPGIEPILATAIITTVADPRVLRSGLEFAAWLGLVPRQNSTRGKTRVGGITKRGNLRRLLSNGASANLLRSRATKADPA
jgi:transposase